MSRSFLLTHRKCKEKCRTFVDFRLRPYPTAVPVDDSLDEGQAYACSLIPVLAVKALKHAEEFVVVFHVKANTILPLMKQTVSWSLTVFPTSITAVSLVLVNLTASPAVAIDLPDRVSHLQKRAAWGSSSGSWPDQD